MTPETQRIGRYELTNFLGGGMSHVYRGKDTVIGRTVALKILTPEGCLDTEARKRFLLEAQMAGTMRHPNIVEIYDFGEDAGRPYIVMEFLDGEDLRTWIGNTRTASLEDKLRIALQIGGALEFIHSQKIIHRDVKPENVRITPNGIVKLMDFGIAKVGGVSRTTVGFVVGSAYYMAPEHILGNEPTPLFDVYGYGILLYELFAGCKPFEAGTIEEIFAATLNRAMDGAPLVRAGSPPALVSLIERCAAKQAAGRPQTFTEICSGIEGMLSRPVPVTGGEVRPPESSSDGEENRSDSRKFLVAGVSAVIVLLLGVLGYVAWNAQHKPAIQAPKNQARIPEIKSTQPQPIALPPLPGRESTESGEMVLVPEGTFVPAGQAIPVNLAAFYVDITEVTQYEYGKFLEAERAASPPTMSRLPVSDISIDDARAYAKWARKRLPTMQEWEKAARGTDDRKYPWGNEGDASRANLKATRAVEVGTFTGDVSGFGVLDMGGNVSEFVEQSQTPSERAIKSFNFLKPPASALEPWVTVRGGSFKLTLDGAAVQEWGAIPARYHSPAIGFRCVRDAVR